MSRSESYIESPDYLKNKKSYNQSKNINDKECFKYAISIAPHHRGIENYPERVNSNLLLFAERLSLHLIKKVLKKLTK